MDAGNPFIYGEVVTATAFANREQERDRLERDLSEGQKVSFTEGQGPKGPQAENVKIV